MECVCYDNVIHKNVSDYYLCSMIIIAFFTKRDYNIINYSTFRRVL